LYWFFITGIGFTVGVGGREIRELPPAGRSTAVPLRYYFDIRDGVDLYPDEEGLELPNQRAAEVEAAQSLVGMAKDLRPNHRRDMAIEVRTELGPLFQATFIFEITRAKH
jgi:hypothetical protein